MSKTKNQHFVPQFYLRGFSYENGQIFVFDKFERKFFKTNIENVACEKNFYDLPSTEANQTGIDEQIVEKGLSELESEFSKSLDYLLNQARKKRRRRGLFSNNHKRNLALFLAIQFLRTREHRSQTIEMMEKMGKALLEKFPGEDPDDYYIEVNKDWLPIFQASFMFNPEVLDTFTQALLNHIWFVGTNTTDDPFFTSDHPIVKRAHITDHLRSYSGIASEGIEIAFPLSPEFILILCERTAFMEYEKFENRMIPLNADNVTYYNSLQVVQSYRQVFSLKDNFNLAHEMYETHPNAFTPNRTRIVVGP